LQLDIIQSLIPANLPLGGLFENTVTDASSKFSTIYCSIEQLNEYENIVGTIRFVESLWLANDKITNQKSFCWVSDTNAIIDCFTNIDQ
jgi:hypothetical protein